MQVHSWYFQQIDEQTVLKAALNTRGSAGPSGLDAELYRSILCSKNFKTPGKELREQIAILAKNMATKHYEFNLISPLVNSRLIPLDKDPGVRPIGIGEVLRRIIGKMISRHGINEIKEAAGPLQACAGHGAGAEAAIHSMREIFKVDETDGILLIDASNAFNRLNRAAALHNIQIICPEISTYVINTYRQPCRLFIPGGKEIKSQEGTTQGDPLAMPWYSLATTTIINRLQTENDKVKQAWLADDASGAGKLDELAKWFKTLVQVGKDHGYYVNGYYVNEDKCWLIVKTQESAVRAKEAFQNIPVNITTEGKRHLGAVIGSKSYKDTYCNEKVQNWKKELETLALIAETEPQSAYAAYTKAYKSKFIYFQRTIEDFEEYLEPIDSLLFEKFIPTLFGREERIDLPEDLIALNPRDGGLGIEALTGGCKYQFEASLKKTQIHVDTIMKQENIMKEKIQMAKLKVKLMHP